MATPSSTDDLTGATPVEVVWCAASGEELDGALTAPPTATVGEVLEALGAPAAEAVIDGVAVPASVPMSSVGLRRGSRVELGNAVTAAREPMAVVELAVVGGTGAGQWVPLPPGTWHVGRSADNDVILDVPSVSARHAELTVAATGDVVVADCASTNGTWVDGEFVRDQVAVTANTVIRCGAVQLCVRPLERGGARLGPTRPGGTRPFNRPPRPPHAAAPATIHLPPARPQPPARARLPWAALIAPLVLGVGMAVLYDPRFAAFALFSPAMMLGTWLEDRRRARRDERDGSQRLDEQLGEVATSLAAAGRAEQHRLRLALCDPATAVARARATSPRLWERRPGDPDFLIVSAGLGRVPWQAPTTSGHSTPAPEAEALVVAADTLAEMPVAVDLTPGNACGITGPPVLTAAAARNLVLQVATSSGPADVRIAVLTDADRLADWDWVKWLGHSATPQLPAGQRLIAVDAATTDAVVSAVRDSAGATLVVVDRSDLASGRESRIRDVLQYGNVSAVVCSPDAASLPSSCTTVVTCEGDQGRSRAAYRGGAVVEELLLACVDSATARAAALSLAGLDDPEADDTGAAIADTVPLLELLGLPDPSGETVLERWERGTALGVPIGIGETGPVVLDVAADGPHGLIAGTTGAGKSELLRSIVAGLAATASPADLTFVLIDYKGGSAFDACARLPHTVGMVTDLDETLGRRALRCLEAELRHRERTLREVGAVDLDAYRAGAEAGVRPPLPRLLVAVDEFATLAAEMPDFIDRLVSVAQRGRSLGVHLLLATQRPAGAVSDNIRANTNLRVALRVQDAADSNDVIGSTAAAQISRRRPGRGYVRLGPGELVAFQGAHASGRSRTDAEAVRVEPFRAVQPAPEAPCEAAAGPTDLERLVVAARDAFEVTGLPAPRRPWPEPLPLVLPAAEVPAAVATGARAVIGLADDPDGQQSLPYEVDLAGGGLLLYGALSSGPTAALATIALAAGRDPEVDCYVIDAGSQVLTPLAGLPHVGAVVRAGDRVRQERLLRFLTDELTRRRAAAAGGAPGTPPTIVLLVDNYAGFASGFDDLEGLGVMDMFARIVGDGPALGVTVVISADRANAVPPATAASVARRLLFRMPDRSDYTQFGVAADWSGDLPADRAIDTATHLAVQLVEPPASLGDAVRGWNGPDRLPAPSIRTLPPSVSVTEIADVVAFSGAEWKLPLGLDDSAVAPAGWHLGAGDHALVTGPARSGKSTVLATVAQLIAKTGAGATVAGVALRRSPLRTCAYLDDVATASEELEALLLRLRDAARPTVLLIDDADAVDDAAGLLQGLLAQRRDDLWCIAAGRADVLRTQYGHWTVEVRRSRLGLALRPNLDLDGDLWHTPLPRRRRDSLPPGRGYLVTDGIAELLQAAAS